MKSKHCPLLELHSHVGRRGCPCSGTGGHSRSSNVRYSTGGLKSRRRWDPILPESLLEDLKLENRLDLKDC